MAQEPATDGQPVTKLVLASEPRWVEGSNGGDGTTPLTERQIPCLGSDLQRRNRQQSENETETSMHDL